MYKYKKLYSKYKPFILPVVLIIIPILLLLAVIFPTITKTVTYIQQVNDTQEEVRLLKEKLAVLDQLDEQTLKNQALLLSSAIPSTISLPSVFQTVEGLAQDTNISIETISISSPGNIASVSAQQEDLPGGVIELSFGVKLFSSFDNLKQFLVRSTGVLRFVQAKSFRLSFTEEDVLRTQMEFATFVYPFQKKQQFFEARLLNASEKSLLSEISGYKNYTQQVTVADTGGDTKENPFQ